MTVEFGFFVVIVVEYDGSPTELKLVRKFCGHNAPVKLASVAGKTHGPPAHVSMAIG
jgi:hypothetical protein